MHVYISVLARVWHRWKVGTTQNTSTQWFSFVHYTRWLLRCLHAGKLVDEAPPHSRYWPIPQVNLLDVRLINRLKPCRHVALRQRRFRTGVTQTHTNAVHAERFYTILQGSDKVHSVRCVRRLPAQTQSPLVSVGDTRACMQH